MSTTLPWARNDAAAIARALAVTGGHLTIGRGGYALHYARGSTLSGYDIEPMKATCIAGGLPVIDSRMVDFGGGFRTHHEGTASSPIRMAHALGSTPEARRDRRQLLP